MTALQDLPLRAALDVNPLLSPIRSGVPNYVESLIRALLTERDAAGAEWFFSAGVPSAEIVAAFAERSFMVDRSHFVPYHSFYDTPARKASENPLVYHARSAPTRLGMRWRKTLQLPPRRDLRLDVFHHTDYVAHDWAGAKCRHVMTIHDLIPVRFPERCRPDWLWFAEKAYAFAKQRAESVITYSRASQQDICGHLGLSEDQVAVIPLAVRDTLAQPVSEAEGAAVLASFGLAPRRYVLAVGRLDPLKNLERLVEAFAAAANQEGLQETTLVLTGPRSDSSREDGQRRIEETLARHGLTDRCVFTGFVSDAQLAALLQGCQVFVFPSLYEGFGLPVLEAMAQGAPVVTSNVSSLPEVAGDAAILVDPTDTEAIAAAILEVAQNAGRAAEMRAAGRRRAAQFSWAATAAAHLRVYRGEGLAERP
ncbi:MAG: glycosyltransferase family 4 protein [Cytophagales bacterium]|nr:glycosyltransferase family 4 protein [Armatimonadota bacterium]